MQPRLLKFFWVGSFDCSILCRVHLFNSGLLYRGGTFGSYFGFLIFLAFRLFPGELIRTLASENKKPDHIEYDRVSFYIDARLLILGINNESYVSWKLYIRFKINPRAVKLL